MNIGSDLSELDLPIVSTRVCFDTMIMAAIRRTAAQGEAEPRFRNLRTDAAEWLAGLVIAESINEVVELGTSNGFSTLFLAGALSETGGHLTTYEKYPDRAALAIASLRDARVLSLALVKIEDGVQDLPSRRVPINLLFMDIWPGDYITAVKNARHALRPGSLIVADNMLEHRDRQGRIHSAAGSGAQEYLEFIDAEPGCRSVLLSHGCGLLVTRLEATK